jgi:predicted RNase H-like nuclease (RuvC/YqgF family)
MLKKILIGLSLVLIVAVANTTNETQKSYEEIDMQTENYILKLKLEILELKEQNAELKNVIEQMELKNSKVSLNDEKLDRAKAIAQLRKDLSSSISM